VAVGKMASPPDLKRPGAIEDVDEIYDALYRNGLTDKTIVDPAFGGWSEAKTLADDRETFHRLREFRAVGQPILVSINRKNFLRSLASRDTEGALPVSLAATAMAVERGAHVVRTHDVAETRDAAIVGDAFTRERVREESVEELDVTAVGEAERHIERVDGDADPGRAVARSFLLELSGEARAALAEAAAGTETVVTGTDRVVLAGTVTALREVAASVEEPAELVAALDRVREACR
ncbi:MAG: dihydropteroate synthase, partial [Halosimplex sp.]